MAHVVNGDLTSWISGRVPHLDDSGKSQVAPDDGEGGGGGGDRQGHLQAEQEGASKELDTQR